MSTEGLAVRRAFTGVPAWAGFALLAVTASAAYLAGPILGLLPPWTDLMYTAIAIAGAIAIVVGVRRNRPRARRAWLLIAAGQAVFVIGDVLYLVQFTLLGSESYPGIGEYLYLASYPLTAAGLAVLVRRRTPGWHLPSVLDAAILAIGSGLPFLVYVIMPLFRNSEGSSSAYMLVSLAYPMMDLLVLTVAVFLILGAGIRPVAYYLLIGGLGANLVSDIAFAVLTAQGIEVVGTSVLDVGWLLAYALLGVAALHPSMRRLDERSPVAAPDSTLRRLAALALASLAAPGILYVQYALNGPLYVPVIAVTSALLFLLVLARMALLVAGQRREAITDALTGLHTRRFFEESLRVEAERVRRHGGGFGVLLLDIDHFKRVNDTYGHPGGDRVLCEVARRLRYACRAGDVVARYGGEEFGILLPGTTDSDIATIAENIRAAVAGTSFAVDGRTRLTVTISGGTATLPADGPAGDQVVLAADRALYRAKDAGRNRISGSRELTPA